MHIPPPPNTRELLPPLLACLPTSFISPRPPPALLPLLSPVLRQRVNFLSGNNASASEDGWLRLLSWDPQKASHLPAAVERMQLEPHPVSGEIELDDTSSPKYRRIDSETLHSRVEVDQFDLIPTFVWCEDDQHGETGPGWKLADLSCLEDKDNDSLWFDSPSEAQDAYTQSSNSHLQPRNTTAAKAPSQGTAEDDDDDYWAAYDQTPNQTPAQKRSPAPPSSSNHRPAPLDRGQPNAEAEYFARYGDVQPAMDSHDPDEDHGLSNRGSTLSGDQLVREQARQAMSRSHQQIPTSMTPPVQTSMYPADPPVNTNLQNSTRAPDGPPLSMPRPISPTSSHSSRSSIARLESEAAALSSSSSIPSDQKSAQKTNDNRAQLGIKQHISTDMKSLYRLAKSVGMDREEFERIVKRELEVLSFMDMDE